MHLDTDSYKVRIEAAKLLKISALAKQLIFHAYLSTIVLYWLLKTPY